MYLREQAEDFLGAYLVLLENFRRQVDGLANPSAAAPAEGDVPIGSTMGPAIVCLSFSVELYVKYLHYAINGISPRGHNILALFKSLPEATQMDVFDHQAIAQYGWVFPDFEAAISKISDGFEKWRYAHESVSVRYEYSFAMSFVQAVRFSADSAVHRRGMNK